MYGFIRSAVEERGSSCGITSRSAKRGSTFSIPITVISTSGSVVHMPVALRLEDADGSGLRDRKVRAADPDLGSQEFCAQEASRCFRQRRGVIVEMLAAGELAAE